MEPESRFSWELPYVYVSVLLKAEHWGRTLFVHLFSPATHLQPSSLHRALYNQLGGINETSVWSRILRPGIRLEG